MAKETVLQKVFRKEIRLDVLCKALWANKMKFILPCCITFVAAAAIIISIPRYYRVTVMLAPEFSSGGIGSSGLGGLASMVGINTNSLNSKDALQPLFYPDLIRSTDFVTQLYDAKVRTQNNSFEGSLQDYLMTQQKQPWWSAAMGIFSRQSPDTTQKNKRPNPFALTEGEQMVYEAISGTIQCSVDKKTDVITLTVQTQDPLVAALLADTVKARLQDFITEYRTRKSRNDLNHIEALYKEAFNNYKAKQKAYANFADANLEVVVPSYKMKESDYENDMQLSYNAYTQAMQQLQLANAKLLERTPAFTTILNATVPVRPAGPKRMVFVAFCMMLAFTGTAVYVLAKEPASKYLPKEEILAKGARCGEDTDAEV